MIHCAACGVVVGESVEIGRELGHDRRFGEPSHSLGTTNRIDHQLAERIGTDSPERHGYCGRDPLGTTQTVDGQPHGFDDPGCSARHHGVTDLVLAAGMAVDRGTRAMNPCGQHVDVQRTVVSM